MEFYQVINTLLKFDRVLYKYLSTEHNKIQKTSFILSFVSFHVFFSRFAICF